MSLALQQTLLLFDNSILPTGALVVIMQEKNFHWTLFSSRIGLGPIPTFLAPDKFRAFPSKSRIRCTPQEGCIENCFSPFVLHTIQPEYPPSRCKRQFQIPLYRSHMTMRAPTSHFSI